jgi:hypothetical protein
VPLRIDRPPLPSDSIGGARAFPLGCQGAVGDEPSLSLKVESAPVKDPEEVVLALWMRWNREVSISFSGDGRSHPWSVMVEGDQGSYGGESLLDALEHRLQEEAPRFSAGWGADAH